MKIIFLEEFGKAFIPKRIRPHIRNYLLKAGITGVPYKLFGAMFYLSIILTFAIYFYKVYPIFFKEESLIKIFIYTAAVWFLFPIAITVMLATALYFYLDLKIFNRTKKMETVLPDFLRFVSENLRGGMPFEKALWSAIKPEFGILASEVRLAAKKVMTGEDVEEALHEFTSKYDSPMMRRSFDLIIEGLKGGGEIAGLIERVVEDLEETQQLKAEMSATNLTYVIFVTFVVIAVAPLLFSLSYQFLIVLKGFSGLLGPATQQASVGGGGFGMFQAFGQISVEPENFKTFSRAALATIAVFSSMIVSMINTGSIRGGIKYVPFFIVASQVVYIVALFIINKIFGGLFSAMS
jgi:type II secretory pathway component PulF